MTTTNLQRGSAVSRYVDRTRSFYEAEVRRHGLTCRGLGYRRAESQRRRFAAMLEVGDLEGARVLDVGAGLGDFLAYLVDERRVEVDYTALELCSHLAAACEDRVRGLRGARARVINADILELEATPQSFDYVLASGIFGLDTGETDQRIRPTLARLFALCRRAVAVNFLSVRATSYAARSLYVDPRRIMEWAFELTPAVAVRHDYLPNDFTVYLYREDRWPAVPTEEEEA